VRDVRSLLGAEHPALLRALPARRRALTLARRRPARRARRAGSASGGGVLVVGAWPREAASVTARLLLASLPVRLALLRDAAHTAVTRFVDLSYVAQSKLRSGTGDEVWTLGWTEKKKQETDEIQT